jgi:hypothetical protein
MRRGINNHIQDTFSLLRDCRRDEPLEEEESATASDESATASEGEDQPTKSLHSDPPVGTGLSDPNRQMHGQANVPTPAHPSAHPCHSRSRYCDQNRHT